MIMLMLLRLQSGLEMWCTFHVWYSHFPVPQVLTRGWISGSVFFNGLHMLVTQAHSVSNVCNLYYKSQMEEKKVKYGTFEMVSLCCLSLQH